MEDRSLEPFIVQLQVVNKKGCCEKRKKYQKRKIANIENNSNELFPYIRSTTTNLLI